MPRKVLSQGYEAKNSKRLSNETDNVDDADWLEMEIQMAEWVTQCWPWGKKPESILDKQMPVASEVLDNVDEMVKNCTEWKRTVFFNTIDLLYKTLH